MVLIYGLGSMLLTLDLVGGLRFVGVHPTLQPYFDALYPIPTGHDFGDGTAEYPYAPTEPTASR